MSLLPSFLRRKRDLTPLLQSCLFLDTETAGLDASLNGVLSVGAVTIGGAEHYAECHQYSHQKTTPAALKVNGFKAEDVKYSATHEKPSAHAMVLDLVTWARTVLPPPPAGEPFIGYIVGKNPRFDYEMLRLPWSNVYERDPFPLSYRTIDISTIAAMLYLKDGKAIPPGGVSSGVLQEYVGLPPEPTPHNALTGAKYARDQFLALMDRLT
jgi:hypothetical protein